MAPARPLFRALLVGGTALATLGACSDPFDFDLRRYTNTLDTSEAALQAVAARPSPDNRGVISYPNYQVAVARQGDTIADVAARVGLPTEELARYNGISTDIQLRRDEVIALPQRVSEPSPATGAPYSGPIRPADQIDVATLAGGAIERADAGAGAVQSSVISPAQPAPTQTAAAPVATPAPPAQIGSEPVRHQVKRGETASILARQYGVSLQALAEWNGLDGNYTLREGQHLLIPVASQTPPPRTAAATPAPGAGSATPVPPSAAAPLPAQNATPAAPAMPASPNLGAQQTASSARFTLPVPGPIVRDYDQDKSAFVLFQAAPGTPVKVADAGTVRLISKNAEGVEIMVVDHGGGVQTAYSFIDGISVQRGDSVTRGQTVARVAQNEFNALQFMVFQGTQTVDPTPFLR
ncbi:MAG: LysM peptidoglycan-binding domain-containing protein [Paracoccaceae bacterium]